MPPYSNAADSRLFRAPLALIGLAITCAAIGHAADPRPGVDWPQFRGIAANGVSEGAALPTDWDVATGRNIAWKTDIPGLAHSSPIVWGDRVFVTTAIPVGGESSLRVGLYGDGGSASDMVEHTFRLYCLNKKTGETVWQRDCKTATPQFKRHTKATHCNPTPATDGRRVVAMFGSQGLYAFDMDGKPLWSRDLGPMDVGPHDDNTLQWGFASSPIIVEDRVVLQCDVKSGPFLIALDAADGRDLWRVERLDVTGWSSPTAYHAPDGWQILMNGCQHIGAVRLSDGSELWRLSGGGGIPVPTPVVADGLVYLTSNHRPFRPGDPQKPIFVVKADARGQVTLPEEGKGNEQVAWWVSKRGNYMQTPLIYHGVAYFCYDNGLLSAFDAKTGEELYRERLTAGGDGFTASGVAGDGKLYFTSEQGEVHILRAGRKFERIGSVAMGEVCMATPAVSDGMLLIRTQGRVVAVAGTGSGDK
ncbi:MAG: PQQ-binding-like beta-propeller repeat protein [Phycisphaerales bacterium]|nr:PQQ-binding-like beta-propeller repeat protein [Phycisphaerales bacterium]